MCNTEETSTPKKIANDHQNCSGKFSKYYKTLHYGRRRTILLMDVNEKLNKRRIFTSLKRLNMGDIERQ